MTALDALQGTNLPRVDDVLAALSDAVDTSLQNVPKFEGRTLIALDGSGSMQGRPIKVGSLFAATLAKANGAEVLLFSDDAKYVTVNKRDSTLTVANWLAGGQQQGCGNQLPRGLPDGEPCIRADHHPLGHAGLDGRPRASQDL